MARRSHVMLGSTAFLFAAFNLFPLPARGEELVKLTPHFSLTGYYDDNVDFSPQTGGSDVYAVISPGLSVLLDLPWLPIETDFTLTRYQYRKRSDLNRTFYNFSIKTLKALNLFKSRTLTLDISDEYKAVPVNVTEPSDQPSNLTQRNIFSVTPAWEMRFSRKMKAGAGYEFSRVDYLSSGVSGDDYFGHRFFTRFIFEVERSLSFFQRNSYEMKYFNSAPDFQQFVPEAGLTLGLGKKWALSGAFGYSFNDTGGDKSHGYVYSVTGKWVPTSKISLAAVFSRRLTVDIEGQPYTERNYELSLRYDPVKRLGLESYLRYHHYTLSGVDTKYISLKAGIIYRLNKWAALNGGYIRIENVDMPPEDSARANRVYLGVNITL